jgi:dihydrolipoamide dehydrogenase
MAKEFDVIVIGAGPGGYIAAVRAAQLGKSVAVVEKWRNPRGTLKLGGTCLNVGCIPSKALLASSEEFENAAHHLGDHGIEVSGVQLDIAKMLARKDGIVERMTKGIEFLFRKNKITWLKGHGKFTGKSDGGYQVEVSGEGETETVTGRNVIIATGSKARHLPFASVDNRIVADNEGALSFDSVPKKLVVIGAGVIGLELGSVWRRLGADVTVLEALPTFLASADEALAKEAFKQLTKQGLKINLGVDISAVTASENGVTVRYRDKDGGDQALEADRLIVSVGRVPNTDKLGLESIGLSANERGFIEVDDHCRTQLPNLYAIGDVVRGPMLAHKAEDEGVMVAELIDEQKPHIDRQERAAVESGRPRDQNRTVSVLGERPRAGHRAGGGFRQDDRGREHRRTARCAHHLVECIGPDRGSGGRDGIQGGIGRHRPDQPPASVVVGGDARGGPCGRQARA